MSKILVVDDAQFAIEVVKRILAPIGAEFITAGNGTDGLIAYREHSPDLVICDLCMPGMDGYAFLRRLAEIDPHHRTIILTADAQEHARTEVLRLGAAAFFSKPVDTSELLAAARTAIAVHAHC